MKNALKYILFAIILYTAFVLLDWIGDANPNWGSNAVQTLLTVAIYGIFRLWSEKEKKADK